MIRFTTHLQGRFADKVASMVVGDGLNEDTQVGPMVNRNAVDKAHDHVTDAAGKGARILCGGKVPTENEYENGHYIYQRYSGC